MKHVKLLGAASIATLVALTASPALAGTGTTAGSSVVNTATVNFSVGGIVAIQSSP